MNRNLFETETLKDMLAETSVFHPFAGIPDVLTRAIISSYAFGFQPVCMFDFDALEIADPIPSDLSSGLATGLANVGTLCSHALSEYHTEEYNEIQLIYADMTKIPGYSGRILALQKVHFPILRP